MSKNKRYSDELERALSRPDADRQVQQLTAYANHYGSSQWPEEHAEDFGEILEAYFDDPEKALAYVILALSISDDPRFLALMGCGALEDMLRNPSDEMLGRIVAEARKSARFGWLLSQPFKVAISEAAWNAIEKFRSTGPHEEPSADSLPPRG